MKDIIYELGQVALKTVWLALAAIAVIGLLRLMAWSDTGMRGDGSEVIESFIPKEVQP